MGTAASTYSQTIAGALAFFACTSIRTALYTLYNNKKVHAMYNEDAAHTFVNTNAANYTDIAAAEFNTALHNTHKSSRVVWDFVPVLVYVDSYNNYVAYYDEEVAAGYIADPAV